MRINTKGVELSENVWLDKEGTFLFKIEKIEADGFTMDGAEKEKFFFKGVEVGKKEPIYSHSEMFTSAPNMLWKIKQLEVALKAPEEYDTQSFVGRYVIAHVKADPYKAKDGSDKIAYKVKSWEYSAHNDKLPSIEPAKVEYNVVVEDNDSDEIPF